MAGYFDWYCRAGKGRLAVSHLSGAFQYLDAAEDIGFKLSFTLAITATRCLGFFALEQFAQALPHCSRCSHLLQREDPKILRIDFLMSFSKKLFHDGEHGHSKSRIPNGSGSRTSWDHRAVHVFLAVLDSAWPNAPGMLWQLDTRIRK